MTRLRFLSHTEESHVGAADSALTLRESAILFWSPHCCSIWPESLNRLTLFGFTLGLNVARRTLREMPQMKTTRIIGAALALLLPTLSAAPAVPRQTGQPKPYLPTARAQRENAYLHLHFLGLMTQFIEEARPPFQANTIMGSMMSRQARLPLDPDLRRFLTLYGLYAQAKGIVEKEAANYFAKSDIAHWVADALSNYREGAITKEGLSAADTLKLADYARRIKEIEARYEPQINEVIARFHTKTGGEYKGFYGTPPFFSRLKKNVIAPPQQTPP